MLGVADVLRRIDNWRVKHLIIAFFVTRVLWKPDQISADEHYPVSLSPFVLMQAEVREPLLGQPAAAYDWIAGAAFALGGSMIALPIIGYGQRRIISWI
jgi:ABC-type polysaccharide/polyol phosphate export permease